MIRLSQAVVVEGRYDKIKLDSVVDGLVITTDGFHIFKDKEMQQLIKRLAAACGVIVLTDSDDAGFQIRKFISDIAQGGEVLHAYIPEQVGKEKRKQKAGKAGLVGVEGMDVAVVEQALLCCIRDNRVDSAHATGGQTITVADLFADGLNGCAGAAERREQLLRLAGLPTRLSTNAMLDLLTRFFGYAGYKDLVARLKK